MAWVFLAIAAMIVSFQLLSLVLFNTLSQIRLYGFMNRPCYLIPHLLSWRPIPDANGRKGTSRKGHPE